MDLNYNQTKDCVVKCLQTGLVPFIHGSPGLGKSALLREVAKQFNLLYIDVRLSQCDPTDLNGLPMFNAVTNKAEYRPMNIFPLKEDKLPDGYTGWLISFDEMNTAPKAIQAASYKILLDREVGQNKLHSNVAMVAAGNLSTDGAIVTRQSTALSSRMIHFNMVVDINTWINWALKNEIDHKIISYIKFKPEMLHKFDTNHNDHTFPCPRTWEFLSTLIRGSNTLSYTKLPLLVGAIGEGAGREFFGYCEIFLELPTRKEILANPHNTPIPEEPSTLYALTGYISSDMTDKNVESYMYYIDRLPAEFKTITLQLALKRDINLLQHDSLQTWISNNADNLI